MKVISFVISFLFLAMVAVFIFVNISNLITFEIGSLQLKANVGFVMFFSVVVGSLITVLLGLSLGWSKKPSTPFLKRQTENEKLKTEIESDKVKQLQAKIETLEAALKVATRK